jgi:hypothetical protein
LTEHHHRAISTAPVGSLPVPLPDPLGPDAAQEMLRFFLETPAAGYGLIGKSCSERTACKLAAGRVRE